MKRLWWRTGPPIAHAQPIQRPRAAQWLRQFGVLCAIAAIWGGGFLILLSATASANVAPIAAVGTPQQKATPRVTLLPGTAVPSIPTAAAANTTPPSGATPRANASVPPITVTVLAGTPTGTTAAQVSFQRDVLPIFTQVCVKCHGGEKTQRSLVLKSFNDVMQGSENGPVIEPGDPANSLLVQMIVQGKMPKNGPKLLPDQIRVISDWVKEGAPNN